MKRWLPLLLAAQCALTPALQAESFDTLSPTARLRRLSMTTRGRDADLKDKAVLLALPDSQRESWLRKKAEEYIRSDEFETKMLSNLSRLFRVREYVGNRMKYFSSLHHVFSETVRENQSWDKLLTSQKIAISLAEPPPGRSDFFNGALTPDQAEKINEYIDRGRIDSDARLFLNPSIADTARIESDALAVETNSPRIAGILTDSHFLSRYWTTPINQNRKRAAQIFRIFLCDEMRAVILPDASSLKAIEDAGLDNPGKSAELTPVQMSVAKRHASDPKCSACHTKLDPLANVFRGGSDRLPGRPVKGELTFKRRSGETVQVSYRNAQELAQAIVAQPEYVSCQVRHFWDWFIGSDVVITAEKEKELVAKFNEVGRRPREFAKYLVNSPDFYRFPHVTMENISFRQVSGLLRDCQSCHDSQADAPYLAGLPFSDFNGSSHAQISEKIVKVLDLLGDGSKASMPPQRAGWNIHPGDRARLAAWLANGAPDESGRFTWSAPDLQSRLKMRLQEERISFDLRPTFELTARRRMTSVEFARQVKNLMQELIPDYSFGFWGALVPQYNNGATIEFNLDSGATISSPTSSYAKELRLISNYIATPALDRPQVFELLGLNQLGWLPNLADPSVNQQQCHSLTRHLFVRLFGELPSAQEDARLKAFASKISNDNLTLSLCAKHTLTQLLWSSRNLTY